VLLISDLGDDPQDIQRLIAVLSGFHRNGVTLRVIALNAAPNDAAFFQRLIGNAAAVIPAGLTPTRAGPITSPSASFPTLLVVLAALVALLLAALELRNARLRFGERRAEVTA
jgi:hypothetical protein